MAVPLSSNSAATAPGVMMQLAERLEPVDPEAARAVKALAHLDTLIEGNASVEALVRGAAMLGASTAGLSDEDHSVYVRVDPDGRRSRERVEHDPRWLSRVLIPDRAARVWLESTASPTASEQTVLDRLALGARLAIERTRGGDRASDEAKVEVLVDPSASASLRLRIAATMGLAHVQQVRALAVLAPAGPAIDGARVHRIVRPLIHISGDSRVSVDARLGIGVAGGVLDLPESFRTAVAALRYTASSADGERGPASARADGMGGLLAFAEDDAIRTRKIEDVEALNRASELNPDLLTTLDAFVTHASARAAAETLRVHHSTIQLRLQHAEKALGWPISTSAGRFRLQLAMALRLIQRDLA